MSTNRASTSVPPNIPTEGVENTIEEVLVTVGPDSRRLDQSTEHEHPLPLVDHLPVQGSTPMPQDQGYLSLVKEAEIGLGRADELEKSIDGSETWEGAVGRIKWLMDTLSPVAGVRIISVSPVFN